jgi:rhamnogalacturonyl hydrolase YesR
MSAYRDVNIEQIRRSLPAELPPGIAAIIRNYFDRDPISFNTDWAGTMPMWALTMWARRGVPGAIEYVRDWFEAHLKRDPELSDEEFLKTYTGHASRVIRGRHLPFTMYSGLFGLAFPCAGLFQQTGDERARDVCVDIADAILYRARRNGFGLTAHDDHWEYDIPDAGFFTVQALMSAASVAPEHAECYVKLATTQLRAYIDVFLSRTSGLAHTILGPKGLGKTFWCRAQGWLMWTFIALLRGAPVGATLVSPAPVGTRATGDTSVAPTRTPLRDLEFFADGVARTADADGAIHAFANDPSSLQETTGTAMVALGLHESIRRGWLDRSKYHDLAQRMWNFCRRHITDEGGFEKVYVEWALPAELYVESSKTVKFGPHIGALLWLAHEMTARDDDAAV